MLAAARDFFQHASGLRRFVRTPLRDEDCLARLTSGLAGRSASLLDVLDRGVFRRPGSPYHRLFEHAGLEQGDVERLVADEGVDGALERLCDAGVYVSVPEFRGARPIERGSLSFDVSDTDFDNPLAAGGWQASTGGSRSLGRQVLLNAEHLEQSALYYALFLLAHDAVGRPEGIWRPFPTRTAVNNAVRSAKQRRPIEHWFSQTTVFQKPFRPGDTLLAAYAIAASRVWAARVPRPEHVPFGEAFRVARWLADEAARGTPALLSATVGSAARVCVAAAEHGADITGTLFRAGGEPLTPPRAALIESTGSTVVADYSMAELGRAGVSCAAPNAVGDVHLMADKVAVVQRPRVVPTTGETVGAMLFTTLLPSAPKLMINVETDDYAVVEDRDCGCLVGRLGFTRHLHGIRSYEKLTSEGVTLRGQDVLRLLETTLPARFGGAPTDYQLVEEIDETLPTLSVLVSPHVGALDEQEIVDVVLGALATEGRRPEDVAALWRGAGTLRVVRREPYATSASKVLPIHVRTGRESSR
jgi:hypothetical protein